MAPGEYSGLSVSDGESHYYGVELDSGDTLRVSIRFDHSGGDLDLAVHDPDGNGLENSVSVTDDEHVSVTADRAGTYYIEVYGFAGGSNTYDLHIQVD